LIYAITTKTAIVAHAAAVIGGFLLAKLEDNKT